MTLVSQQLPGPASIAGREDSLPLQPALPLPRFVLEEVADARLCPHEFTRARPLQPLGGAAVRLHLRHRLTLLSSPTPAECPTSQGGFAAYPPPLRSGGLLLPPGLPCPTFRPSPPCRHRCRLPPRPPIRRRA